MRSIGLGEAKGVEVPGVSGPYFIGVTISQSSPTNVGARDVELGVVAEAGKVAHRVVAFPWVPQPIYTPLFSLYTWKLWPP
jgi:hypothetical protein